ncbi:adhesive plaque matrix protein-like [Trematomus bernacchii]|uniref:adhesive plaque matrix protein-like n=1 Tax=Trematomus bernacchii TaxID=40690 RepID=UPI00146F4A91|nr:adhesive plaque matrix protein-like [Trematomus bernacchii]
MYFELCVRVLVLSLLIFGQQAKALSSRIVGPSGITTRFHFSRRLKPASTSSDDSSAQPERVLGSYSPFHADGALSKTLKPAAAPSGSHGRQVDGYSPEGSVSSYGPSQPIIRKPNQLPQANPSANGVLPTKAALWAFPLPHNPNSFQSGIASSSAIVMHSGPYSAVPSKPQEPKNLPKPQQARYKPKPHQPKPQQAANPSNPLQSWYRPKPQQAANPSIPQQAKPYQPSYPLKLQQAANPSNPLQSRYWPKPQQTKPNQPSYPSNPQQAKPYQRSYPSNPQQAKPYQRSYPSNPQQAKPDQRSYPSNPQQAKPFQRSYPSNPQQAKPDQRSYPSNPEQAKPFQRSYPSNPQQAKPDQRSYPSNPQQPKPQQAEPLQGVLQSKAGMWDIPSQGSVASGSNVQPTDSNSRLNVDPTSLREIPMSFLYQPRWQQQLVPV